MQFRTWPIFSHLDLMLGQKLFTIGCDYCILLNYQFLFRVHSDMDKFKEKAKQCATDALQLFDSEVNQGNSSGTYFLLWPSMEYKHLMTGPLGNSEFCFPETLNVPQGEAEGT